MAEFLPRLFSFFLSFPIMACPLVLVAGCVSPALPQQGPSPKALHKERLHL